MTAEVIKQTEVRIAGFLRLLIRGQETCVKTSGQDLSVQTQELLNALETTCDVLRESGGWRTRSAYGAAYLTPSADGHSASATSSLQIPLAEESTATAGDTVGIATRAYPENYTSNVSTNNEVIHNINPATGVDLW